MSADVPTDERDPRALVADALGRVAPDIDLDRIDPADDLATAAQLDSMDFLAVVTRAAELAGRDIPERDYPRLATLAGFVTYLAGAASPPRA